MSAVGAIFALVKEKVGNEEPIEPGSHLRFERSSHGALVFEDFGRRLCWAAAGSIIRQAKANASNFARTVLIALITASRPR